MKKLADLIIENPDLEVVVVAESAIEGTDYDSYFQGAVDNAYIDYVCKTQGLLDGIRRDYIKSIDEDSILQTLEERICYLENTIDEDYLKNAVKKHWDNIMWRKAIVVYVR